MIILRLDGREITDRRELHDRLARLFSLPDYYGRNLDALWDCLSERSTDTVLCLEDLDALEEHLGSAYTRALLRVLRRAQEETEHFQLTIS